MPTESTTRSQRRFKGALPHDAATALGLSPIEPVTTLPSIAHLFGTTKKRCGIYLLAFESGLFYIGQAVDAVRRFSQHRRRHDDIVGFAFMPVARSKLDATEKATIYQAELQGLKITNAVHVTQLDCDTDLDEVVPVSEQEAWLGAPGAFKRLSVRDARIELPEAQYNKFAKNFSRFQRHPLAATVLPLLDRYVQRCLPAPRRTEYTFWSVSCMPATNATTWPRLFCVNAGVMELMVVGWRKDDPSQAWGFVNIAVDVLLAKWGSSKSFGQAYPFVELHDRGYRDAGQHQVSLHVMRAKDLAHLLADEAVTRAAATLSLRVMRKRATIYGKFHCPQLAQAVLGS